MPRPKSTPGYCLHKPSGRAYVTIDGRMVYLGVHGSTDSRDAYDRVLSRWYANGRRLPAGATSGAASPPTGPTVSVVIEAFWRHATAYHTRPVLDAAGVPVLNPDGTPLLVPSKELDAYRQALRPLRRLFGPTPAAAFGCAELEAVREAMIRPRTDPDTGATEPGWCRTYTNRQVGRLKRVFAWAVTKNLVAASVHDALLRLPGLRAGKTAARESEPVGPVDEARALALVPHVSRQVGAMIRVQLATGMRSTEVCIMRPCDIDRSQTPWVYKPAFHKTQGHGIAREVAVGPKAREVLSPFIDGRDPAAFLFSPAEADAERQARRREDRKTPVQQSQVERAAKAARRRRGRAPGGRYTDNSYCKAIMYGCELAFGMPKEFKPKRAAPPAVRKAAWAKRSAWHREHGWHPHMIRHRSATDVRKGGGLEAAQVVMGHTSQKMTQLYAEADVARAHEVIERIG